VERPSAAAPLPQQAAAPLRRCRSAAPRPILPAPPQPPPRPPSAEKRAAPPEALTFVIFEILVSPSTMRRTAGPKRRSMSSKHTASVSSTVSCSRPATRLSASMRISARMRVTWGAAAAVAGDKRRRRAQSAS
jgi:hypothetical protein